MDKLHKHTPNLSVGFLLIDGFALMSYAAAIEPLRAANLLGGATLYDILTVTPDGAPAVSSAGAMVPANHSLTSCPDVAFLFVVAGGDPSKFTNETVFAWLRTLSRSKTVLAGVSGGPVILVNAGVMAGRRMTVHWEHAPELVHSEYDIVLERTLFVRDRDRMTCAGGTAPLDMMHALITTNYGAEFARQVSDWFLHTDIRPSGGPQKSGASERYGVSNPQVIQAIELMESHIGDPLSLSQLAALIGISARQLNRLFVVWLGTSTMAFYRQVRLSTASRLVTQSTMNLTEIALATGFANSAHFAKAFTAEFGRSASDVRRTVRRRASSRI